MLEQHDLLSYQGQFVFQAAPKTAPTAPPVEDVLPTVMSTRDLAWLDQTTWKDLVLFRRALNMAILHVRRLLALHIKVFSAIPAITGHEFTMVYVCMFASLFDVYHVFESGGPLGSFIPCKVPHRPAEFRHTSRPKILLCICTVYPDSMLHILWNTIIIVDVFVC